MIRSDDIADLVQDTIRYVARTKYRQLTGGCPSVPAPATSWTSYTSGYTNPETKAELVTKLRRAHRSMRLINPNDPEKKPMTIREKLRRLFRPWCVLRATERTLSNTKSDYEYFRTGSNTYLSELRTARNKAGHAACKHAKRVKKLRSKIKAEKAAHGRAMQREVAQRQWAGYSTSEAKQWRREVARLDSKLEQAARDETRIWNEGFAAGRADVLKGGCDD